MRVRVFGERQEPLRVPPPPFIDLTRVFELLGCVFADRLQHPEPLIGVAEEALVDE